MSKTRQYLSLAALGIVGGAIWIIPYLRYVFYDQWASALGATNTQIGLISTVFSVVALIRGIPGAYFADKFDAKKIIIYAISSLTVLTFIYAFFTTNYTATLIIWTIMPMCTFGYWPALVKYINNLGDDDSSGNAYGTYYLINGLTGAVGNAIPLWVSTRWGFRGAVVAIGIVTTLATLMVIFFLESEKQKRERGVVMQGDGDGIKIGDLKYVFKCPGFWFIGFGYTLTYTLYTHIAYFTPYLVNVIGMSEELSSTFSIVRTYGTMLCAPIGGLIADKVFHSTSKWFMVSGTIIAAMIAGVFFFREGANQMVVGIYSVLPAFVIMALYSVQYSLIRESHIPGIVLGTAVGLSSMIGNPVDSVYPALFGHWMDAYGDKGYNYIFIFLIVDALLVVALGFIVNRYHEAIKSGKKKEIVIERLAK